MNSPRIARLASRGLFVAAVALLVAGTAGTAAAAPPGFAAPEISPGALGGAMTLLAGGLLLVREKFRAGR